MELCCSFKRIVGGVCSHDRRDRSKDAKATPILACKKDISSHLKCFKVSGIQSEIELILCRAGMFKNPQNVEEVTICPNHRSKLGTGWSRGGNTRCRIPIEISGHKPKKLPKAERGVGKAISKLVMKRTGKLIQIGSGICTNCEKILGIKNVESDDLSDVAMALENLHMTHEDSEINFQVPLDATAVASTPKPLQTDTMTSIYEPPSTEESADEESAEPKEYLNRYLLSRDKSPIRFTLNTPWEDTSERTKRHYTRKAKQVVETCIQEIAPKDQDNLIESVISSYHTHENVDSNLLEALTEVYNNASHWSTRRQVLSIIGDKVSYKELQKWIPDLTRYRYNIARHHRLLHGRGTAVPHGGYTRMHIKQDQLDHFLTFITSPHVIQDLPYGEKSIKLSTDVILKVPNVIRTMIPAQIIRQYQSHCEEDGVTPMSSSTLTRVLNVCSASVQKSLQGLDYFSADGTKAFDEMHNIIEKLGDDFGMGLTWAKDLKEKITNAKRYLKSDYKVHICKSSKVPDHCQAFALSYGPDKDFISPCDHEHNESCDRCSLLPSVVSEVKTAIKGLQEGCERDEILYELEQAVIKIEAWKAHIIRSINQDQARLDILKSVDQHSALLVLDWAMKFLPRKYREAQSDWFAKRGLSWHLAVAICHNKEKMQMLTFAHVFEKCTQTGDTVLAIIDDVFRQLKETSPEITTVHLRQDNAGCYHSTSVILSVHHIASSHNIKLSSMDFSDPQGGKGSCDRKAATIKGKMKIYLNEGHDIETAQQMVTAMESHGGIPGVRVRLCGPQNSEVTVPFKWDGISYLNNFNFNEDGIRVWRAYGIGPGKVKPWKECNIPEAYQTPTLDNAHDFSTTSSSTTFSNITARKTKRAIAQDDTAQVQIAYGDEEYDKEEQSLFFCDEEGCIKAYQYLSSLQRHLDCGTHKYALERETLYDKAAIMYAAKLEQGSSCDVPQITSQDTQVSSQPSPLKMGWALKSTKEYKRLTDKQKRFLQDIYDTGAQTGKKADPAEVSKMMRKSRQPDGEPLFASNEYLTSQQIASFFSRVTKERRKASDQSKYDRKDEHEISTENLVSHFHAQVLEALAISHPILFEQHNLCDLAAKNKLDKFSINILQDICSTFQLDVSDVKIKRKKPYINVIKQFLNQCTCTS